MHYDDAAKIVTVFAEAPDKLAKKLTNKNIAQLTPATVHQVNMLLNEFSHPVVQQAAQIRNLVVNKLLLESDNEDPKIRIRSLELLGKISDVGLFTEKTEVTVTHQTTDDLKKKLREKLSRLGRPSTYDNNVDIEDGVVVDE